MRTQTIGSQPRARSETSSRSEAVAAAVLAALLGSFLIWGVGFSHIDALCCTDQQPGAVGPRSDILREANVRRPP